MRNLAMLMAAAACLLGARAEEYDVPKGTLLYYPFDTCATALRSFGADSSALVQGQGAVSFSRNGKQSGCLRFDGASTLELRTLPEGMPLGKAPYTVSAWIRADKGLAPTGGWIGYGERNTSGGGNSFRHNGTDGVQNYWNFRDLNVQTTGLADGKWHQVVGTWDGETRTLYFDGTKAGSDRQVPDVKRGTMLVGATINDRPYTGWIDEVLVATRAFGPDEVRRLFENGIARNGVAAESADAEGRVLSGDRFLDPARVDADRSREIVADARWLMLPVRNGEKPRRMTVSLQGKVLRDFEIALAAENPDWYAALDISEWKGRKLLLKTDGGVPPSRALALVKTAASAPAPDGYDGMYRPQFHFSPIRGWMNDPNGLSFYKGEWHYFYQHNPYGTAWGNMHWGHAVSRDLFHWKEVGEALYLDPKLGAMFSGSAVVDKDNTAGFGKDAHVLVFTGTANGSTQCIAYSLDGRSYTKYEGNPVVPNITGGNRDPRVFWYKPGKHWVMALYVVENKHKNTVILNSPDLKNWTRVGTIVGDSEPGGGFLHECPELFELPIEGENETRWIVFGATGEYGVGTFDGKEFQFEEKYLSMTRNLGGYYAAQTFGDIPDGRRILLPWFQVKMPGMPFNQSTGMPRTLGLRRTSNGLRIVQYPVKEVESLRKGKPVKLEDFDGELAEIFLDMDVRKSRFVRLKLRGIDFRYDAARELLSLPGGTTSWPLVKGRLKARIFIDRIAMETFSPDGLAVLPSQDAKADPANRRLEIVEGAENVLDDRSFAYELKSVWK